MTDWGTAGRDLLQALGYLLPFLGIGVLLVMLQLGRQIALERKLFHAKLHTLARETGSAVVWGLAAGLAASLVLIWTGAVLTPGLLLWVWGIALLLSCIRIRLLCFAYAVGVVGVMHGVLSFFPDLAAAEGWSAILRPLLDASIPSLLVMAAVLHGIEALLVRMRGSRAATPLLLRGKRGKVVGGYGINGFWPVPLLVPVPASGAGWGLPWTPLFLSGVPGEWTLAAFPVVIGFTTFTQAFWPWEKVRRSALRLLLYGTAVALLALAAWFFPLLTAAAALLTLLLHETVVWLDAAEERRLPPRYVQDGRGLKVLAVLPGSPADELGIRTGEVLYRVNGKKVANKEQLHAALQENPAYCRLEVLNHDGESKFLKRALYSGEHHLLGILPVPDGDAGLVVQNRQSPIWRGGVGLIETGGLSEKA